MHKFHIFVTVAQQFLKIWKWPSNDCILCVKLAIFALCVNLTTNHTLYKEQQVLIETMITHLCVKVAQQYLRLYVNSNNNYTLCIKAAQYLMQNV